ncbi:MAG: glycosyltransferase family 2 protein [Acidobacteriaceae bacterium]|nr:glycosyltransferase family 2 protein [Acidobacteriaceae bacterium]MBV9781858.1 glycosyltransferase family 2 protein [Acidobacteriaceae bacterium]
MSDMKETLPTVSVIIPCRNEARFISKCLDSVLTNGYPLGRLEILVVDGMSDDGTREIGQGYAERYKQVQVLTNARKLIPCAVNIGVDEAKGEIVMRVDAHTVLEERYIERCVRVLVEYGADDVGGKLRIVARDDTSVGRTIVKALTQRVGVGNLRYRFAEPEKPEVVDTVPFFCCWRDVFDKIGPFNEKLARVEDVEFKRRLVRAGGQIMLAPGAAAVYQARSQLRAFWKHNLSDGMWVTLAFGRCELMPVPWRHLAPPVFVGTLLCCGLGAIWSKGWLVVFLALLAFYFLTLLGVSVKNAMNDGDWSSCFLLPFVTFSMHLMRGLGSLWGVLRLIAEGRLPHAISLIWKEQRVSRTSAAGLVGEFGDSSSRPRR